MRLLLDTCVLAELRHPQGSSKVRQAITALPDDKLFLSVVTLGEVTKGIALLPIGRKRRDLEDWLNVLLRHYRDRILPVDTAVALSWGVIAAHAKEIGLTLGVADGLIAATPQVHGLTVATRNIRHFQDLAVPLFNPWQG